MLKKKGFDYIICFTSLLTTALFPFTHASTTSIHERHTQPETYASFQDPMKQIVIQPRDVFKFTNQPSSLPSLFPSITTNPTKTPSSTPSSSPTSQQTLNPSKSPSSLPSNSRQPSLFPSISTRPSNVPSTSVIPSLAPSSSSEPSNVPSTQYIHAIVPTKPEVISSGPWTIVQNKTIHYTEYEENAWTSVKHSLERDYWSTFSLNRTLDNRCGSDPVKKQSPIDLCPSHVNYKCYEHHQIRNRGGDYNLTDEQVTMKILPSKLRIEYSRENAILSETKLRPPNADFPHNWNGYIQVTHIDIKIPSEHTICGKRYDGEYQIYFYHPLRRQPIVKSILIEVHPQNRSHLHFQKAIDEWQRLSDSRYLHCLNDTIDDDSQTEHDEEEDIEEERQWTHHIASRRLNETGINVSKDKFTVGNRSTIVPSIGSSPLTFSNSPSATPSLSHDTSFSPTPIARHSKNPSFINEPTATTSTSSPSLNKQSTTRTKIRWNPFEPRIVNSIYFYGYTGSLTEPPCSEWVHWRVLDTPMQISSEQLTQLKEILFQQLDEDCQPSSFDWKESVARPIQSLNERPLWQCTSTDYLSDEEKRSTDST